MITRVFWDTNIFIYLLEPNGVSTKDAVELLHRLRLHGMELATSVITSAELQTGPLRRGDTEIAAAYKQRLQRTAKIIPFGEPEADRYAQIRQLTSARGADAVQLASASVAGTELFVTNDLRLHKCHVPGIHFIVSVKTALELIH